MIYAMPTMQCLIHKLWERMGVGALEIDSWYIISENGYKQNIVWFSLQQRVVCIPSKVKQCVVHVCKEKQNKTHFYRQDEWMRLCFESQFVLWLSRNVMHLYGWCRYGVKHQSFNQSTNRAMVTILVLYLILTFYGSKLFTFSFSRTTGPISTKLSLG